mmetsp:Transcript_42762/g.100241  ORF Transcript_42762/g.100241 Transcript_42762/m.100241 type:complete len:720 (-) Transcript_42762:88-2247(-)
MLADAAEPCRSRGLQRRPPSSAIAATPLEKIPAGPVKEATRLTAAGTAALELWLLEPTVGVALKRQGLEALDVINACTRGDTGGTSGSAEARYAKQLLAQLAWEVDLCAASEAAQESAMNSTLEDTLDLDITCRKPLALELGRDCSASRAMAPCDERAEVLLLQEGPHSDSLQQGAGSLSVSAVGELLLGLPQTALSVNHGGGEQTQFAPQHQPRPPSTSCPGLGARRRQKSLERAHYLWREQRAQALLRWEKKERAIEDFEESRAKRVEEMRSRIREKSRQKEIQLANFQEEERRRREERHLEVLKHQQHLSQQVAKCERRQQQVQELMGSAAAIRRTILEENRLKLLHDEEERKSSKTEKLSKAIEDAELRRQETLRVRSAGRPELRSVRELARRQAARVERIKEAERDIIREAYEAKFRENSRSAASRGSRPTSAHSQCSSRPASAGLYRTRPRPAGAALQNSAQCEGSVKQIPSNSIVGKEQAKIGVDVPTADGEQDEPEAECTLVSASDSPRWHPGGRAAAPEPQAVPWPGVCSIGGSTGSTLGQSTGQRTSSISPTRIGGKQASQASFRSSEDRPHSGSSRPGSAGRNGRPSHPASGASRPGSAGRPVRPTSAGKRSELNSAGRNGSGTLRGKSRGNARGGAERNGSSSSTHLWDDVLEDFVGLPYEGVSEEQLRQEFDPASFHQASLSFAGLFAWAQSESGSVTASPQEEDR